MLSIVIIDDEERIRYLVRSLVPEKGLGLKVVGEAGNGIDGLRLCSEMKPEIILTDIRMPGMDGLLLMEELRKTLPDSKVIIISGYDEFAYAQRAVKSGAFDYVLKPLERDDFFRILEKAKNEILKGKKEKEQVCRLKNELVKLQKGLTSAVDEDRLNAVECRNENVVVRKTLLYIHENYNKDLTLEEVAEKAFMNITYFSELFKKQVGKGFTEYVTEFRLEKAKNLLKFSELKVGEITGMVGYSDPNYFIRVFKKYTGITPHEFKLRNG